MKTLIFIISVCIFATPSFALSDAEYRYLKSQSYEYRQADNELTVEWKRVMKIAEGSWRKEILDEQRNWVKYKRDKDARDFMSKGFGRTDAYIQATIKKTNELRNIESDLRSYQDKVERGAVKADSYFDEK